ncbi:MAG: hypothetical protein R3B45_03125 [Bdellovibrionota bacterium]
MQKDTQEISLADTDLELQNPTTRKSDLYRVLVIIFLLATLALSLKYFTPSEEAPNDAFQAQVFYSLIRENVTEPLKSTMILQEADKIEIKVSANHSALAWFGLYAEDGSRISSEEDIANSIISIGQDGSEVFTDNITLKATNRHEVVVILVCKRVALEGHYPSSSLLLDWFDGVMNRDISFMDGCVGSRSKLR